jgi:NAD(P)-dependent dehydrogenase (short-subunit alcohol dehydrogenase family)
MWMAPMSGRFEGQVALVTGGASGIGAAIVARLLGEGARVLAADINADALAEAEAKGPRTLAVAVADVTVDDQVRDAVATAISRFGRLDLAFNVAGAARFGSILDGTVEDWSATVDLLLKGTYLGTRHAALAMREGDRGGAIVNVASLNAHVPLWGASSYAAGKAGAENFTKGAALELAPYRIRVNAVLPGLVETPLTAPLLAIPGLREDYLRRIPLARAADPDDIAGPCVYLASDDARYITGTSLVVDGGWEITNYPDLSQYV